jgi:hypothetical protein
VGISLVLGSFFLWISIIGGTIQIVGKKTYETATQIQQKDIAGITTENQHIIKTHLQVLKQEIMSHWLDVRMAKRKKAILLIKLLDAMMHDKQLLVSEYMEWIDLLEVRKKITIDYLKRRINEVQDAEEFGIE